jgi:hypothetical protein
MSNNTIMPHKIKLLFEFSARFEIPLNPPKGDF